MCSRKMCSHELRRVLLSEVTIKQLKEKLREYDDKMESAVQVRAIKH